VGAESGADRRFAAGGLALATLGPLVLAPMVATPTGTGISPVLGVLVVVAYVGHVPVTGWLWADPGVRRRVRSHPARLVALPAALALGAVGLAVAVPHHWLVWLLLAFFAWQFHHFQRQNLGLVTLVAAMWGAGGASPAERRAVAVAGWCGVAGLVTRPVLLGLGGVAPPPWLPAVAVGLGGATVAGCAVATVVAAHRDHRPAVVAGAAVTAVLFVAPVFVFHGAQAAVTGMVVAHGLQYLWVVGLRTGPTGVAPPGAWRRRPGTALGVVALAVVGGALLSAMAETRPGGTVVRAVSGAYFGIVLAHFSLDGALWRRPSAGRPTPLRRAVLLPSRAHGGR